MSNAPVVREVIKPARKIVSEVVGGGQAPQPRQAAAAPAPAQQQAERRMMRQDQAQAAQEAGLMRARRAGGYRSLLSPGRAGDAMKGAARTLGGG